MRSGLASILIRQLRRSVGEAEPCRTDADLVRRFATERDADAFAELVHRHGPLVWGVCRRSLANRADAEDAFQATFLVLAKNAASIRKPETLGAWLHGVAHRIAQRMRQRGESLQTEPVSLAPSCLDALSLREFLAALDDELAALPEKYRGPLVLCFLQERTQDDAAKRLGVSLSTLKRRLDAGRELLRGRLTRRGVELPAVLLTAGLGGAVPVALAEAAVQAATGGGVVSASVLTITEGVIQAMWETKLRAWVVGALMATTAIGGTGYFAYTGYGQTGGSAKPIEKKADPNDRLRAAELDAARAEIAIAETALAQQMKGLDRLGQLAKAGTVSATELAQAEIAVEQARAQLLRAKAQYEVAVARMEAEKQKAARETDRDVVRAREEYDRVLVAQTVQPEVQKLREEKVKVARTALKLMTEGMGTGAVTGGNFGATVEAYHTRSVFLLTAERELNANPQAQLKAAKDHLARLKELESFAQERAGKLSRKEDVDAVTAYRIEAEIWVKEAEAGMARVADPRPNLVLDKLATVNAQVKAEELANRLMHLEQEVRQTRDQLDQARAVAEKERLRSVELMQRLEEMTQRYGHINKGQSVPAEGFRGAVKDVDGDVLILTPGADAGLIKGAIVAVYRPGVPAKDGSLGSPSRYLGTVKILSADPKEAVGRFTAAKAKPAADELPKKGDELRPAK